MQKTPIAFTVRAALQQIGRESLERRLAEMEKKRDALAAELAADEKPKQTEREEKP
jgi:hypothetical protein